MAENKNNNVPRVVRTGPKNKKRYSKKSQSKAVRITKKVLAVIGKVMLTTFLVLIITGCIVGTALTIYVMEFIDSDSTIKLENLKLNFTSMIYGLDDDGNYVEVQSLKKGQSRIWVDLKDIPKYVQDAFVYSEDERFYTHTGVDFKRTFAAFLNEILRMLNLDFAADRFGGSTITQQLIKNINGDFQNRGIDKKIQEIVLAMNLERHYTKEQILELYLNYVGLDAASGVQAGAKYYFGKDVSELTYAEAAALAVITKSPTNYNPLTNPENNKERRPVALKKMLEFGTITQEEYEAAMAEEIVCVGQDITDDEENEEDSSTKSNVTSWFSDAVVEEVIDDLCEEYDYSKEHAEQLLYTGGYQIYSTMEISTQNILEEYFANNNNFKVGGLSNEQIPNASMVIMDHDGNIRALVGGKGEKTMTRGWNNATMSNRPSGSTIKPLAIYAPAIEHDLIKWSTIMEDSPAYNIIDEKTGEERPYPNNYNKKFDGDMTIIDAIKVSKNTIPVKLCEMLTPQICFDFVTQELGITSLVATGNINNVNAASLALGDGGYYLTELTAGFEIFANGGYYSKPVTYSKVTDAEGKVILDNTNRAKNQVISSETAYIMNKALWCVVNDGGSGTAAKLSNMETIGKTGTSNDRKDLLFMGCTPYYVAGIRYGHDDNSVISEAVGSSHINVWQKVMTAVHKGKNSATFQLDDSGVTEIEYCKESGQIATTGCQDKGTGYYKIDSLPSSCTLSHALNGGVDYDGDGIIDYYVEDNSSNDSSTDIDDNTDEAA